MSPPVNDRIVIGIVVGIVISGEGNVEAFRQIAAILDVERESRIFGVPRDEKLSAATSHDHINSRILRLGKDCQGFILFDIGSAYLGISAVRNVKQIVESSENRISLVVFMMGEYSEKFFIQRVFGDSVKMVQPGQSSPTNIESRGDVFVRPVENLD